SKMRLLSASSIYALRRRSGHVICSRAPFDNRLDLRAPCGERGDLLVGPIVQLIDPENSRPAARDMVERGLRDFKPYAELLQARRHRSAEIVQAPILDAAPKVEDCLGVAETVEGAALAGKDERASIEARRGADDCLRLRRQRDDMLNVVLGAAFRNG